MSNKEKNQRKILHLLRRHGTLKIFDVVNALKISEASVRRYFAEMEKIGMVVRFHGGVKLPVPWDGSGYHFTRAEAEFVAEKHAIGNLAALQAVDGDRLFCDSGTTVLECGTALAERLAARDVNNLCVVTNSMTLGSTLAAYCPVQISGGQIRLSRMDLCGSVARENVGRYNFTKAFLGTDGIAEDGTLSTTDDETTSLAAAVIEHSDEVFILADSSKLGKKSFVPYGTLCNRKVTLITDSMADMVLVENLRQAGAKILIAGRDEDQQNSIL